MDRFDIWFNVSKIDYTKLATRISAEESSSSVKSRVISARAVQLKRFSKHRISKLFNAEMTANDIEKCIIMTDEARDLLSSSAQRLALSGRAFHRVIKVARTIADLAGEDVISSTHILEALQYRQKPV